MKIAGLLLAAGKSTRFGRDKLIEPLGDCSIALQSAKNLLPHVSYLTVVIAENNNALANQLKHLPLIILPCSKAHQGMAASLVCGIQNTLDSDGWLIALADMPFIEYNTYTAIITAARHGHAIVAPYYQEQRGHPVFISNKFKAELLQLQGDSAARDLLRLHPDLISRIEVNDIGVLRDVDSQQDLIN